MTTVTTPSKLKKEVESEKELMLRACLEAFNQLPNQRLKGAFPSTYALAAKLNQLLQHTK
ncbi:cobalamin biosynthesis protein CbiX [Salmonella enterica]|uniref:cobalamin biosynthesis protein CbiX n=1 Tax=Escherichia coli TaxID=562 RepID=UPI0012C7D92B|nr:cobalamin biosynthesis protein CbiX [Escherichia coli]EDH0304122.1 cobalamin biosynthesis protein CbiX [Salmonella enterica subsp. enterica serovar Newport]EGN1759555.1 cobalamin biosynthesis protein CbiX [Salmonella enterica]EHJ6365202.1 cobalamin biosynthesis protein CbiX [Salmonella enterica subsp. enterica serovar Braenderup]EHY0756960.1 cobalamin biosynthesis protein CbiX [Salmonella enterica subsp. enterica serovar Norwich]HDN3957455.1 cobalamin biosynthesis protein CbiX [Salmonella e